MDEPYIDGCSLEAELKRLKELVDVQLRSVLMDRPGTPDNLLKAMQHVVFAGGKRMRPILTLMTAQACGCNPENLIGIAAAVELLHTYTLIHDDLPCMDDDDLRRGQPACHKVFGEATALLAGDALQATAFDMLIEKGLEASVDPTLLLSVVHELSIAAGSQGVVAGQCLDLSAEGRDIGLGELQNIHRLKTGELFVYAVRAGVILAGREEYIDAMTGFGEHFGLLFQITDDILDVVGQAGALGKPIGSDARKQKATYPSMLTLDGAWKIAEETANSACEFLDSLPGDSTPLYSLAAMLLSRDN
jgi:geranylgeranyl diphosphate synthase type II